MCTASNWCLLCSIWESKLQMGMCSLQKWTNKHKQKTEEEKKEKKDREKQILKNPNFFAWDLFIQNKTTLEVNETGVHTVWKNTNRWTLFLIKTKNKLCYQSIYQIHSEQENTLNHIFLRRLCRRQGLIIKIQSLTNPQRITQSGTLHVVQHFSICQFTIHTLPKLLLILYLYCLNGDAVLCCITRSVRKSTSPTTHWALCHFKIMPCLSKSSSSKST